jgi:predicted site-specific integrase-resolvase
MTDNEHPLKITKAADVIGVSYKTIYNWLENGYLKLYHPGYVLLSDVRRAQIRAENATLQKRTEISKVQKRGPDGRFILGE